MRWSIIASEYPPQRGGVADYSRLVARGLAQAGDEVEVWAPATIDARTVEPPIVVRGLSCHFGPRSILELNRFLKGKRENEILVQYEPFAFGMKAMNLPFCLWLYSMRAATITLMFHEVGYPIVRHQPFKHTVLGATHRLMALLAARSARRIFVSTPAWMDLVRSLAPKRARIEWLPVPSNVLVADDATNAAIRKAFAPERRLIGHFGTYGPLITRTLAECVGTIAAKKNDRTILLMGRGSREFRERLLAHDPGLSGIIHATGGLSESDLSRHVAACDLMIQPYPDGVSSRRTTIMLALSHGIPTVTNPGVSTEPCWRENKPVALSADSSACSLVQTAERLLSDERERRRLRDDSRKLYAQLFDISHTIEALRRP